MATLVWQIAQGGRDPPRLDGDGASVDDISTCVEDTIR